MLGILGVRSERVDEGIIQIGTPASIRIPIVAELLSTPRANSRKTLRS
jgi:hypothetical protein